jgi:hypothetical protein
MERTREFIKKEVNITETIDNIGNLTINEPIKTIEIVPVEQDFTVLMFNGEIKKIKDIIIGDQVMGADSLMKTVVNISSKYEKIYKVTNKREDSYTVNA